MIEYRSSARYIDSAHSAVQRFSKEHARGGTEKERAVALYYAVRRYMVTGLTAGGVKS